MLSNDFFLLKKNFYPHEVIMDMIDSLSHSARPLQSNVVGKVAACRSCYMTAIHTDNKVGP